MSSKVEELFVRKAQLEEGLANIEKQIYIMEEAYHEETHQLGNVEKGFEGFLQTPSSTGSSIEKKHSKKSKGSEHIFSNSSSMYQKFLSLDTTESQEFSKPERKKTPTPSNKRKGNSGSIKKQSSHVSYGHGHSIHVHAPDHSSHNHNRHGLR